MWQNLLPLALLLKSYKNILVRQRLRLTYEKQHESIRKPLLQQRFPLQSPAVAILKRSLAAILLLSLIPLFYINNKGIDLQFF